MGSRDIINKTTGTLERRLMDKEIEQGLPVRHTGKWRCICGGHSQGKETFNPDQTKHWKKNRHMFWRRLLRKYIINLKK